MVDFGRTSSISVFTPAQTYCRNGESHPEFNPVGLNKASVKTPLSPYCDSKVFLFSPLSPGINSQTPKKNITDEILNTPPVVT